MKCVHVDNQFTYKSAIIKLYRCITVLIKEFNPTLMISIYDGEFVEIVAWVEERH